MWGAKYLLKMALIGRSALVLTPNIYYPPPQPIVFHDAIDDFSENMGSGTDLGKALLDAEYSHLPAEILHFTLDIAEFSHITIAAFGLAEVGIAGGLIEIAGTIYWPSIKRDGSRRGLYGGY